MGTVISARGLIESPVLDIMPAALRGGVVFSDFFSRDRSEVVGSENDGEGGGLISQWRGDLNRANVSGGVLLIDGNGRFTVGVSPGLINVGIEIKIASLPNQSAFLDIKKDGFLGTPDCYRLIFRTGSEPNAALIKRIDGATTYLTPFHYGFEAGSTIGVQYSHGFLRLLINGRVVEQVYDDTLHSAIGFASISGDSGGNGLAVSEFIVYGA